MPGELPLVPMSVRWFDRAKLPQGKDVRMSRGSCAAVGMGMRAFDLGFGHSPDALRTNPDAGDPLELADAVRAGWAGFSGPGIDPATWPRGPFTGLPMVHVLTLRLPEEYRRRGPQLPAIAFFQGDGPNVDHGNPVVADPESSDPFVRGLAAARRHPQLRLMEDVIGGAFALIWLTEEEFGAGPTSSPDGRRDGENGNGNQGTNARDDKYPVTPVWLGTRDDPNAGLVPSASGDTGYQDRYDPAGGHWYAWAETLWGRCHLGGTTFCYQAIPAGLTPFYLELTEFGGLNFGTGNAQIDLDSDVFDWAC